MNQPVVSMNVNTPIGEYSTCIMMSLSSCKSNISLWRNFSSSSKFRTLFFMLTELIRSLSFCNGKNRIEEIILEYGERLYEKRNLEVIREEERREEKRREEKRREEKRREEKRREEKRREELLTIISKI